MRKLLYGRVVLFSELCPVCDAEAFVIDNKFACCGEPFLAQPNKWKRMSTTLEKRKKIPKWKKEEILENQNYQCFYCFEPFSNPLYRRGKLVSKQCNMDHIEPFAFASNNDLPNIVAACSVCNGIKSDLIFPDIYECRNYINQQRRSKGYHS